MPDYFKRLNEVWDAYLGELERLIGPSTDSSLLQPYNVSHGFPADAVKYPKFTNFIANRECNVVTDFSATSNNPISNSPILTGATLQDRYEDFLGELGRTVNQHHMTPEEQAEESRLRADEETKRENLYVYDQRVDSRWLAYKQTHNIPSDDKEWIARQNWEQFYLYAQTRHDLRDALLDAGSAYWLFQLRITPASEVALRQALEYWRNPSYEEVFPPSTTYENEDTHEHWGRHKSQTLQLNYDDFFANNSVRKMTINEDTTQSNTRTSRWSASGGFSIGFVTVGGSGGGSSTESHIRENIEKIEFSWDRLEEIPVFRAPWFQEKLFTTYGKDLKGFWGPGGRLGCFPTHVSIGRGLKISLYIKATAKDDFKKSTSGGGFVMIGPFGAGGSGGGGETSMTVVEKDFGFLVQDDTKAARVVAVRVERPNYISVKPEEFDALLAKEFSGR